MPDSIQIRGVRQNNLQNIDITIPRDKLVVITGLSGSGIRESAGSSGIIRSEGCKPMTITLELTPEQEAKLKEEASAAGVAPAEFLLRLLEEQLSKETTGERLRRLGILGGAIGKPRADGRPWSEIEGFE